MLFHGTRVVHVEAAFFEMLPSVSLVKNIMKSKGQSTYSELSMNQSLYENDVM